MLRFIDVHVRYGGIKALKGISLEAPENGILTLLGSNGAGKSTAIRAASGLVPLAQGDILFQGRSIKGRAVHQIQQDGLVHIPEGRKIFANLTVRENLLMGAYHNHNKKAVRQLTEHVCAKFPVLENRMDQYGGTLSGGEQQMLAIGRALMAGPKMLMMDEPSLGLAPIVVAEVFRIISEIQREGVAVFLVEQNATAALGIADRALILETGVVTLQGTGAQLACDPAVRRAYLGETH